MLFVECQADPTKFCATLGHKINHIDETPNTEFDFCFHPRFGAIRSIVTTRDVAEGEELFVNYSRASHADDDKTETDVKGGEKFV